MTIKIKLEIDDGESKTVHSFKGLEYNKAKEKILKYLDTAYDVGPYETKFKPEFIPEWTGEHNLDDLSQKDKVMLLLRNQHKNEWIKSQELLDEYEEIYGEKIKLSSLSTYLARFHDEGIMERKGSRAQREYKLIETSAKPLKAESGA